MTFPVETLVGIADSVAHSGGTVDTLNSLLTCAYLLAFNDTVRRNNFLFHVLRISSATELATIRGLVDRSPHRPITQYARDVFVDMGFIPEDQTTTTQLAEVLFGCSAAEIMDLNAIRLSFTNARSLNRVTTVVLTHVSFADGENITNFLPFLPSLISLSVAWVEYGCLSGKTDPLPDGLRSLSVTFTSGTRNRQRDTFIAWLARSPSMISSQLGRLTLTNITDASVGDVLKLLSNAGTHLDLLSLTIAYGHTYADDVMTAYTENNVHPVILYENADGVPSNQFIA